MAKRGRKPLEAKKGYFYEREEQAVKDYIASDDEAERNMIYNTILKPAFTIMIESIIRKYNLYVPEEEFDSTFEDTMSFLMMKINHFDGNTVRYRKVRNRKKTDTEEPEEADTLPSGDKPKGEKSIDGANDPTEGGKFRLVPYKAKAYSYCGTICKNYLIHRRDTYNKGKQRSVPYEDVMSEVNDSLDYSYRDDKKMDFAERLIDDTVKNITDMIENDSTLTENEIKVGKALILLMENWEEIFSTEGSVKFNKSAVLFFLRENTGLSTKDVRDSEKKYKKLYYLSKELMAREED